GDVAAASAQALEFVLVELAVLRQRRELDLTDRDAVFARDENAHDAVAGDGDEIARHRIHAVERDGGDAGQAAGAVVPAHEDPDLQARLGADDLFAHDRAAAVARGPDLIGLRQRAARNRPDIERAAAAAIILKQQLLRTFPRQPQAARL